MTAAPKSGAPKRFSIAFLPFVGATSGAFLGQTAAHSIVHDRAEHSVAQALPASSSRRHPVR
jgi:hypothetical protein